MSTHDNSPLYLTVDSPAVRHGIGLFETMLVVAGTAIQLRDHCQRIAASAVSLGFPAIDEERFMTEAERAAKSEGHHEPFALRCLYIPVAEAIRDADNWRLHWSAGAISSVVHNRRALGRAVTLSIEIARSLPRHKMTSYSACVIGLRDALDRQADEGLFVTREGEVLEGTATNVFALSDGVLVTAPLTAGVLPGTVRRWVIDRAHEFGMTVVERPPTLDELYDGAFLSGSLTTLAELRVLNGRACRAPGKPFGMLVERYREDFGVSW